PRPSNSVWLRATAKRTYACCRASMDSRLAAPRPRCRVADRHLRVGEEVEGRADHLRDPFDPRQGDLQGGPANLVANGDRVGRRLRERTLARASRATERGRWAGASGPGLTTGVRRIRARRSLKPGGSTRSGRLRSRTELVRRRRAVAAREDATSVPT